MNDLMPHAAVIFKLGKPLPSHAHHHGDVLVRTSDPREGFDLDKIDVLRLRSALGHCLLVYLVETLRAWRRSLPRDDLPESSDLGDQFGDVHAGELVDIVTRDVGIVRV